MIVVREVNILKIEDYIRGAWIGDRNLKEFYDKGLKKRNLDGMVINTSQKIRDMIEYDEHLSLIGIEIDKEEIGFIILSEKLSLLYSFGINVKYRNKEILGSIFKYVRERLKNDFSSIMYEYNTRAIKWLEKCGMKIDPFKKPNDETVYLKFELCQ